MAVRLADPTELANRLRPLLLMLNRHLRREAHAEGITGGQAALLAQLRHHPTLGVRELAAREGISAPSMTRYLDRLERAGLIVRTRSREDARRLPIALTPKGDRLVTNGLLDDPKVHSPHHRGIFYGFNRISYGSGKRAGPEISSIAIKSVSSASPTS